MTVYQVWILDCVDEPTWKQWFVYAGSRQALVEFCSQFKRSKEFPKLKIKKVYSGQR